ncbi:MAG TPA: phosphate ABC transporter ATP-binding protein, partial [Firmicutes bacterium]|nr:phosphate ABC transporter ATP-binding protein [Bacillota bacterium]
MSDKFVIQNLDLYYDKFQALKNINLNLPEKEISAFIG